MYSELPGKDIRAINLKDLRLNCRRHFELLLAACHPGQDGDQPHESGWSSLAGLGMVLGVAEAALPAWEWWWRPVGWEGARESTDIRSQEWVYPQAG